VIAVFFLVAAQLFLLGANAVQPFRLAAAGDPDGDRRRRLWSLLVVPLLLASLLLALLHLALETDSALAWGISWPPHSKAARLVLVAASAAAAAALLTAFGGRRFEPAAWRFAGALGGALAAVAALAGEMLRIGGAPAGGLGVLLVGALVRFALALAAGECATGRVRWLAPAAAIALPLGALALPAPLRSALRPDLLTLGAAVALLAAARFLPGRFPRPTAAAGVLLAALYLAQSARVSSMFELQGLR
jgi:hypothetical protein